MSKRTVMSLEMYNFIIENESKMQYDLSKGIIITPKGTNGTICSSTGYLRVKVSGKVLQVHQVLAVKYYGEKCIGMQINHINGNKLDNTRENLEAITQSENLKHQKDAKLQGDRIKVPVDKFSLDGDYICTYNSISEACEDVGLKSPKSINHCFRETNRTAKGFIWRKSEIKSLQMQ